MHTLKLLCMTLWQLAKQVWLLPRNLADASKHRQRRAEMDELELERLDRIRNPSKYLGK